MNFRILTQWTAWARCGKAPVPNPHLPRRACGPWLTIVGAIILTAMAAEDLGILSPRTAIEITPCARRGAALYRVDAISKTGTNRLILTNGWIDLSTLAGVPDGRARLVVTSICADGEESKPAAFMVSVQRDPPSAPTAKLVNIMTAPLEPNDGDDLIRMPPMPRLMPLPNATNAIYVPARTSR